MGLFSGSMLIICTVTLNLRKLYNYKFVKVCVFVDKYKVSKRPCNL